MNNELGRTRQERLAVSSEVQSPYLPRGTE
jgi:hypothetical protein